MSMSAMRERPSPNWNERPCAPDMLMLHYTGMQTGAAAIDRLCDPEARVASHYVVEEDGTVWRLVPEEGRAWHAGISCWDGRHGLNDVSIGIEIVNPGHEWGYRPFPEAQMRAVAALSRAILARWSIPPWRVVGHSDVAPDRKQDPGELFDWPRLAREGIGLWPAAPLPAAVGDVPRLLAAFGYCGGADLPTVLRAFQRRFRPARIDGIADAECAGLLAALVALRNA